MYYSVCVDSVFVDSTEEVSGIQSGDSESVSQSVSRYCLSHFFPFAREYRSPEAIVSPNLYRIWKFMIAFMILKVLKQF